MFRHTLLLSALFCFPALLTAQDRPGAKGLAAEERALLQERYDLAKEQHEDVMDAFRGGTISDDEVFVAARRLTQAEFDLATTSAARLVALRKGVENAQAFVNVQHRRVEGGTSTTRGLKAAKSALADAKLLVVRERQRQAIPAPCR
jgi:hypothetical protein